MKKILVTGGCGYIGSHTIIDLIDHGYDIVSIDDLSNAHASSIDHIKAITGRSVPNYTVDLKDLEATRDVFRQEGPFAGIIHFAAYKLVGESVEKPLAYFRNNLCSLLNILECMREFETDNLIFSSSCSVYGNSRELPVTEHTPRQEAESPYGRTKQMGEDILRDVSRLLGHPKTVLLRYFNPAGAHESGLHGEDPANKASNLVPVITETAIGKREKMTVFGTDYDTRDGSCVRDYIHVMDLAAAHTLALQYLLDKRNQDTCEIFNLGIGEGVTVLEAIEAFEKVTGQQLSYELGPRRAGDVEAIYANYDQAAKRLHWQPRRNIEDIMATAWKWEQKRSAPAPS
mgnify:CR=1 FL=1